VVSDRFGEGGAGATGFFVQSMAETISKRLIAKKAGFIEFGFAFQCAVNQIEICC
jgi:hypothetical protein